MTEPPTEASWAELEIVQLELGLRQFFCEATGCPSTGKAASSIRPSRSIVR